MGTVIGIVSALGALVIFVFWVAVRAALGAAMKAGVKRWWRSRRERRQAP